MGSTCHSPREAAVQPGPGTGQQCSVYLRVALPVAPRSSVYIWVPTSPAALRRCPAGTDLQPCPAEGTDPTSTFSGASRDNSGGRHGREGTKANIFSELELVSDDNCLHLKLNGGNFMGIHLCYIAFNSCSVLMHASLAAFAFCKNMLPEGGVGLGSCSSYLIFNITPCCEEYSQFHGNPDEWLRLPGVKCILGASFVPNVDKDQRNYSQDHSDFRFLHGSFGQKKYKIQRVGFSSCPSAPPYWGGNWVPHKLTGWHCSARTQVFAYLSPQR